MTDNRAWHDTTAFSFISVHQNQNDEIFSVLTDNAMDNFLLLYMVYTIDFLDWFWSKESTIENDKENGVIAAAAAAAKAMKNYARAYMISK